MIMQENGNGNGGMIMGHHGSGNNGTRSRKSSLEVVQQNIPTEPIVSSMGMAMDMCSGGLPVVHHNPHSPRDQATYIPPHRSALHSLLPNNNATAM